MHLTEIEAEDIKENVDSVKCIEIAGHIEETIRENDCSIYEIDFIMAIMQNLRFQFYREMQEEEEDG